MRGRAGVERAIIFHDDHDDSRQAARDVADYCRDIGVRCTAIQVDAFDMVSSATAIQKRLRKGRGRPRLFNITGGTKVLNAAAVLTCTLEGVPAVYLHEETGAEIPLPLITARYDRLLTHPQRRVLRHILDHAGCTLGTLPDALGGTKPTMSHHVQRLVDYGLVERRADESDARVRRLHAIPSARLLLDDDA